jgi:hypothetical protein
MELINKRIETEICNNTIAKLQDINLLNEYKKCNSVINKINGLNKILEKHHLEKQKIKEIIEEYIYELIPPGTKGVIRGILFNKIVKEEIEKMNLDKNRFEICFEKNSEICKTTEIPDAYIFDKITNKIIIIMNQLDLINGGQQLNRGYKYIIDGPYNTETSKLLCVICNGAKFKNTKSKAYKLFDVGFKNNTLCYLKNLNNIIKQYFC